MVLDLNYYFNEYNGKILSNDDEGKKILNKAIRQINRLTNNSIEDGYIVSRGEPLLTTVYDIVCEHAEYLYENTDRIEDGTAGSAVESRTLNGVSVKYSSASASSILSMNGVYIKKDLYEDLAWLGLCYKGLCR